MSPALRAAFVAALIGLVIPAAVIPATAMAAEDDSKARKAPDPDEVVCVSEPELGSRLVRRRTCMTRAQWAERRLQDRQTVERSQVQTCARGAGC